jgi:hypothetical protein
MPYTSLRFSVMKEFHLILTKTIQYYCRNIHNEQGFAVKELLVLYLQYINIVYMGVRYQWGQSTSKSLLLWVGTGAIVCCWQNDHVSLYAGLLNILLYLAKGACIRFTYICLLSKWELALSLHVVMKMSIAYTVFLLDLQTIICRGVGWQYR